MVLDTIIDFGQILAAVIGVVGTLFVTWFNRWRRRQIEKRESKIEWYNDLAALATEIQISTYSHGMNFEYLTKQANLAEQSLSEFFTEEEMSDLQQRAKKQGAEIPEDVADHLALEEWSNKKDQLQERIITDMDLHEARLTQHLAQRPLEIDEETFETSLVLISKVSAAGMVGRVNEEYINKVEEVVVRLDAQCMRAIEELESSWIQKVW